MRIPGHQKRSYTWRWTAALVGLAVVAFALVMALVVVPAMRVQAAATVTTLASRTLSADTAGLAPGSGVYTALTGPVVQEGAAADVGLGSIILSAPAGFEFDTSATVTVSVSPTTAAGTKIDTDPLCGSADASEPAVVAAGTITIEVCTASTTASKLTWSGIKVRPISGGPFDAGPTCMAPVNFPSGNITHTGTALIAGAPPTFGVLAETSGAQATTVVTGVLPNGPVNAIVGPMIVCVEDQFGSPAVGAPMTWSISSYPAGATCQQLIAADATTDGLGWASTALRLGHLNGNYQVSASSGSAGPTTDVSTASLGPGAACAPPVPPTSTPAPATNTPVATNTPAATNTPVATATPTPGGPTATPTTGPLESVALVVGCNPVASTYPENTAVTTIAAAVSPSGALYSIWYLNTATGRWLAYSPYYPEPQYSDLTEVDRLEVIFICVDTAGSFARPEL